jgi:hypothetical protein
MKCARKKKAPLPVLDAAMAAIKAEERQEFDRMWRAASVEALPVWHAGGAVMLTGGLYTLQVVGSSMLH